MELSWLLILSCGGVADRLPAALGFPLPTEWDVSCLAFIRRAIEVVCGVRVAPEVGVSAVL